jgi:hypothetical protein
LTLPLVLGAAQDNLPKDWKAFTSKEGGFTVALPSAPTKDKRTVKTATGNVEVTVYLVEVKDQGSYVVTFSEFPDEALKGGTDEKRLDKARDGAVQSAKGKLKSEKRIKLKEYPGRELAIEGEATGGVRTRIYIVKNRLYQTVAAGGAAFLQSKETSQFLDSFNLIK